MDSLFIYQITKLPNYPNYQILIGNIAAGSVNETKILFTGRTTIRFLTNSVNILTINIDQNSQDSELREPTGSSGSRESLRKPMFRLNKLTDYGIVLMTYVASNPQSSLHTAREMVSGTQMHAATVGKIVRELVEHGLLISHRGMKGGYSLARPPEKISVADIIDALEGPIAFTECSSTPGCCELEPSCTVRSNSQVINRALRRTLEEIRLTDLIRPLRLTHAAGNGGVVSITLSSGRTQ